jgi:hypothetical protein
MYLQSKKKFVCIYLDIYFLHRNHNENERKWEISGVFFLNLNELKSCFGGCL